MRVAAEGAVRGVLVGLALALAFLAVHAVLILPIWVKGLRGLAFAAAGGAALGALHASRARDLAATGFAGGARLGLLVAASLAPFALAGKARSLGLPAAGWIAVGVVLALAVAALYRLAAPRAWLALGAASAVANALPAAFLVFAADLVPDLDHAPEPLPIGAALAALEVGAGVLLVALARASEGPRGETAADPPGNR